MWLLISVNPQKGPEIIGLRPEYTTDETITITCKSESSYPAADLNFFIDNEAVSKILQVTQIITDYTSP